MLVCIIRLSLPVVILSALLGAGGADAQTARRDEVGTARLQAVVNQLTAEKAALERRNADLSKELQDAEQELERLRSAEESTEARLTSAEASLQRVRQSNAQTNAALEQTRERMQALVGKFRETAEVLRETERNRNRLGEELEVARQQYRQCARDNLAMYETGLEALDALENKGLLSVLGQNEPFTQLGRVRLENLVDEYRRELEDNRVLEPEPDSGTEPG